jgi:hypothetical protein
MAYIKKEYEQPAAYQSAYSDTINNLVGKVANGEKFTYDPATDAAYQAYAKEYGRLGQQANENTMSNVALNTGGLVNSYAVTAGQQAQNDYNQQLTAKIPELEQVAYERYNADRSYNLDSLNAMSNLEAQALNQYNTDRSYNRDVYESDRNFDYDNYTNQRDFDYQAGRDKVSDQQWQKSYNLDVSTEKFNEKYQTDNAKYQKMLDSWTTLGYATKSVAKYFGVKKGTKTSDQNYRNATLVASSSKKASTSTKSSGRSGGSGKSSGGTKSSNNNGGGNTKTKSTWTASGDSRIKAGWLTKGQRANLKDAGSKDKFNQLYKKYKAIYNKNSDVKDDIANKYILADLKKHK